MPGDLSAYMKARAADADGRIDVAVRGYGAALADAPDNALIAIRAYREAIDAGDYDLADRAAAVLAKADSLPADAILLAIAKSAQVRDPATISAAIAALERSALAILAPSLRGWAAFEAGRDPIAAFAARPADSVARRFNEENRALLLIADGKIADGITVLRTLLGNDQASVDLRVAAAQLLIARNRDDEARALLIGDNATIAALRADPGKGVKPSLAFGASRLFTRIASDLALGPPGPLSIALARAALRAEPGNDRARLLLAYALARNGASERALATLAEIDPAGPFAAPARTGRVQILADDGQAANALEAARALATGAAARPSDIQRFGDLLVNTGRFDEAVTVFRGIIDTGRASDWAAWLQYGGALDRAGRWPEARVALEKAVALGPDQPLALNYLGYARIEHGERSGPSEALLERASKLSPEDPAITDSLGWAYFVGGQTARALPLLERAAAGAPDNATISEHLGDAYWAAGRRYEARYAWRAAAVVAEASDAPRLTARIANGPPAPGP